MKPLVATVLAAGLGGVGFGVAATVSGQPDLVCTLALDRASVAPGAAVTATLTLRNTGRESVELGFSSAQRYDFRLLRGERVVWSWAGDMMFAQVVGEMTLAAGARAAWSERLAAPAEPGGYVVEGRVSALGRDDLVASARLTVR